MSGFTGPTVTLQTPFSFFVRETGCFRNSPVSFTSEALGASSRNVTRLSGSTSGERSAGMGWATLDNTPAKVTNTVVAKNLIRRPPSLAIMIHQAGNAIYTDGI